MKAEERCWEDGGSKTCLLRANHEEDHDWTPDDYIVLRISQEIDNE